MTEFGFCNSQKSDSLSSHKYVFYRGLSYCCMSVLHTLYIIFHFSSMVFWSYLAQSTDPNLTSTSSQEVADCSSIPFSKTACVWILYHNHTHTHTCSSDQHRNLDSWLIHYIHWCPQERSTNKLHHAHCKMHSLVHNLWCPACCELFGTRIKCLMEAKEDQNLNEICIRQTIKCHHLNITSGIFSTRLYDEYTWW